MTEDDMLSDHCPVGLDLVLSSNEFHQVQPFSGL